MVVAAASLRRKRPDFRVVLGFGGSSTSMLGRRPWGQLEQAREMVRVLRNHFDYLEEHPRPAGKGGNGSPNPQISCSNRFPQSGPEDLTMDR